MTGIKQICIYYINCNAKGIKRALKLQTCNLCDNIQLNNNSTLRAVNS